MYDKKLPRKEKMNRVDSSNPGTTSQSMSYGFGRIGLFSIILIAINAAVFVLQWVMSYGLGVFAISPKTVIDDQEYYRIVSSAFTHSGIFHIGMNMMAFFQLGVGVENTFGSVQFLLITTWAILLSGILYVSSLWCLSVMFNEPSWMQTSAVGYSGILFTYAMVESFHAPELTRSLCGVVNLPTKVYPLVLLILLSLLIPGISFMGHLCGLLVGFILITPIGPALFIPTAETIVIIEQSFFCTSVLRNQAFVRIDTEKNLIHPWFDTLTGPDNSNNVGIYGCYKSILSGICLVATFFYAILKFLWQILATILFIVGFPVERSEQACTSIFQKIENCSSSVYNNLRTYMASYEPEEPPPQNYQSLQYSSPMHNISDPNKLNMVNTYSADKDIPEKDQHPSLSSNDEDHDVDMLSHSAQKSGLLPALGLSSSKGSYELVPGGEEDNQGSDNQV